LQHGILGYSPNQIGTIEFPINTIEFPINQAMFVAFSTEAFLKRFGSK